MPIYHHELEMTREFRRKHRANVRRTRREKRNKYLSRPRDVPHNELDKAWLNAVERDADKA